jgi:hypothetical protein
MLLTLYENTKRHASRLSVNEFVPSISKGGGWEANASAYPVRVEIIGAVVGQLDE